MNEHLREKIDAMVRSGERIKEIFDLDSAIDQYILERMAYYRFAIPLMQARATDSLSENDFNNCLIDMYLELKAVNRIYTYPPLPDI